MLTILSFFSKCDRIFADTCRDIYCVGEICTGRINLNDTNENSSIYTLESTSLF
ncbi:hypothetical protein [Cyanobacterium sp. Dongsha4]|uniref:hypothetical protein n=1 Tax=Cyanobacterium sp. DS4 TaxID=2878255 RepID=UPI002E818342|nr:hypothetical protein [Cyanobacterium sp. Dongsha4]WVL00845.1 hypothetical protein Dongsha4_01210 [Cyanobacterium sp. Dongsha4]